MASRFRLAESVKIPFSVIVVTALTAGRLTQSLRPTSSVSDRIGAMADLYALYRLNKLRFRLHPAATSVCMAYLPNTVDTAPNGLSQISETMDRAFISSAQTVPTKWVDVPPQVLRGALPWYKTVSGTPDDWDEVVGSLFATNVVGTTGTEGITYEVLGEYEFKSALDPSNTPKIIEARSQRQREIILKAFSGPGSNSGDRRVPSGNMPTSAGIRTSWMPQVSVPRGPVTDTGC